VAGVMETQRIAGVKNGNFRKKGLISPLSYIYENYKICLINFGPKFFNDR